MFSLDIEQHKKTTVVRYHGTLLLQDAITLRAELEKLLLAQGIAQVAIDLSGVEEVDSSGLGALVCADTLGLSHGRRLILLSPSEPVQNFSGTWRSKDFSPHSPANTNSKGASPTCSNKWRATSPA